MFGSNKKKDSAKSSSGSAHSNGSKGHSFNSLVEGTSVTGSITSKTDIRVDGIILGDLTCEAKVIIGPTGSIEGDIHCQNAVIEGKFDGNITVAELLNIRENAKVNGVVSYGKLIVQSGAQVTGTYALSGQKTKSQLSKNTKGATSTDQQNIAGKAKTTKEEIAG